jgi:hypothetical protein
MHVWKIIFEKQFSIHTSISMHEKNFTGGGSCKSSAKLRLMKIMSSLTFFSLYIEWTQDIIVKIYHVFNAFLNCWWCWSKVQWISVFLMKLRWDYYIEFELVVHCSIEHDTDYAEGFIKQFCVMLKVFDMNFMLSFY